MNVLAALLFALFFVVIATLAVRQRRSSSLVPTSVSVGELIDRALAAVKSLDPQMGDLKESFRASAYLGLGGVLAWTAETRMLLLERKEQVKSCLARMNSNVSTFEEMGQLALIMTMGENELARDIVTKAAGCKVELDHLNLRIGVYDRVPIQMWRLLGKGMATSCLNLGNDLIQQYQLLVERVLAFARARGDGLPV